MITKEKLNELNEKVNEIIILESKIKHYSSYYDALKSLKKIKSGEAEK